MLAGLSLTTRAAAQRFYAYNETTRTDFVALYVAPAGTDHWGANQTINDKDQTLDTSERLTLTGLSPGRFDVKLVDRKGHTCFIKDVDLTAERSFEIRDQDLHDCH